MPAQVAATAHNDVDRQAVAAAGGAATASLEAVLEAINTGQRRMVAHMNSNYKEVLIFVCFSSPECSSLQWYPQGSSFDVQS